MNYQCLHDVVENTKEKKEKLLKEKPIERSVECIEFDGNKKTIKFHSPQSILRCSSESKGNFQENKIIKRIFLLVAERMRKES